MKYTKYLVGTAVTIALAVGHTQIASAQRAEPNRGEQRQERRERMQDMTPEQRRQYWEQRQQQRLQQMTPAQRAEWQKRREEMQQRMQQQMLQNLTPAQRQALIQQLQQGQGGQQDQGPELTVEDSQRALLNSAGVTDKQIQDAIIAFVAEQNKAREPLLALAKTVGTTLADPATPADKVATVLADFRKAAAERKENYSDALKKLDEKISYTTNPRLEAVLTLVGILGEESQLAGGFPAIFPEGVVTANAN